jgi:hypothetical protein
MSAFAATADISGAKRRRMVVAPLSVVRVLWRPRLCAGTARRRPLRIFGWRKSVVIVVVLARTSAIDDNDQLALCSKMNDDGP